MQLPFSLPPDQWKEIELQKLSRDKIKEYQRLEFKRELKLGTPPLNREFLKDITSMANANGGVIIYGIDEISDEHNGKVAGSLTPLNQPDLADQANRIIRTGVSPNLQIYFTSVNVTGGYCLIANIPESYNKPHAIIQKQKCEYYIRRNQDNVPMTETEIRNLYTTTAQNIENMHQRYSNLGKSQFDTDIIGLCTLTCMPLAANLQIANTLSINRDILNTNHFTSWFSGFILRPLVDRFEAINLGTNISYGLRLHQSGDIVYTMGIHALSKEPFALQWVVAEWLRALQYYSEAYSALGYWGQIRLWLEVEVFNDTTIKWSTEGIHSYEFQRKRILVWIDRKVDDLANPKAMCIPLIRYFMQACRVDWTEETAERWLKNNFGYLS